MTETFLRRATAAIGVLKADRHQRCAVNIWPPSPSATSASGNVEWRPPCQLMSMSATLPQRHAGPSVQHPSHDPCLSGRVTECARNGRGFPSAGSRNRCVTSSLKHRPLMCAQGFPQICLHCLRPDSRHSCRQLRRVQTTSSRSTNTSCDG